MWAIGLIPAGAGNMRQEKQTMSSHRAHPRGCGEHRDSRVPRYRRLGSSPRVRGTSRSMERAVIRYGLIPAGAGNMSAEEALEELERAHPRGCGEHFGRIAADNSLKGSSPRVRGTCIVNLFLCLFTGLIPAGAGNMKCRDKHKALAWAHPRGCGEHPLSTLSAWCWWGSSPRVRGT